MSRKKGHVKVRVLVDLDANEIAQDWNHGEALDFIIALDASMADWDFTLKLYEYFVEQKKQHDAEVASFPSDTAAQD